MLLPLYTASISVFFIRRRKSDDTSSDQSSESPRVFVRKKPSVNDKIVKLDSADSDTLKIPIPPALSNYRIRNSVYPETSKTMEGVSMFVNASSDIGSTSSALRSPPPPPVPPKNPSRLQSSLDSESKSVAQKWFKRWRNVDESAYSSSGINTSVTNISNSKR
ncbi:hypothetical protein HK098_004101 [Nowakowskiella sp. JEL0407]|nr:hypothetical protein HK098_004101 [Nowakowskiella sp. JEL0407]